MRRTDTLKIEWETRSPADIDKRVQSFIEEAGWPDDEKLIHKKEQLYLALQQGMSTDMIREILFDTQKISSRDIDYIRSVAMLAGEDFVRQHFYGQSFTIAEAQEKLREHFSDRNGHLQEEIADLIKEKETARQTFEFNMQFITSLQKLADDLNHSQKDLIEATSRNAEQLVSSKQIEIEHLKNSVEEQRKIADSWKQQYETIWQKLEGYMGNNASLEKLGCDEHQLPKYSFALPKRESFWRRILKRGSPVVWKVPTSNQNSDHERMEFVTRILGRAMYTEDQLDLVLQAVKENFTLEELQQLCQENIKPANMARLFEFIKSRKEVAGR